MTGNSLTPHSLHVVLPMTVGLELLQSEDIESQEGRERILILTRAWLADMRHQIKEAFLASGDAKKMLSAYTQVMDGLLLSLFKLPLKKKSAPIALVAIGGYGRGELFPYSDIDLLFLFESGQAAEAKSIAEFMLYILWDLGLKVGQAHRNTDETIALARQDNTILTSLLDARFLTGNRSVYEILQFRLAQEVLAETALEFVDAKLAERDGRHVRFGDSRYMLEPNVKEGKGGLRDLHILWWLARYIYRVRSMKELVDMQLLTKEEYRIFHHAQQFLWQVRIYLHYAADRAEDRLTFDRQHSLALSMGYQDVSVNRSIERFMRRYFLTVRTVGGMTRIFCALLEDTKKRKPRTSLAWLWHMPWKLGAFRLDGERLDVRHPLAFEVNPVLMLELFRVAQLHKLDVHPRALQLIGRNLRRINEDIRHDAKANALFMDMLLGDQPEITLRRMNEAGVLGKFIPDFGRIIGQTQFNMYHVYTVDEHTLVAIGILCAIEKGLVQDELPLASDIIHRISMRRVLYLALFCHDIGKGRKKDHSELGEKIAARLAERFGLSRDEIETSAWLVRYHLLFSNTAFKRDINDPKTIHDFVRIVRTPERLKLLLVLTAADIRAVGPAVWNAWKGGLLRDLYQRAEQLMGTGEVALKHHQTGPFREELKKQLIGWTDEAITAYLEQGNPSFWANFDLERHAIIARMLKQAQNLPLQVNTHHDYARSYTEIIVCAYDQPSLFSQISGAMTLAGANIINAKIFTLKNGMVVDVFQVQDIAGQVFDRPGLLAKMSVYMQQSLTGDLDPGKAFKERMLSLGNTMFGSSRNAVPVPAQVFIENDASNICSVIELTGHDRPGFLYDVTHAIALLRLSIETAHITTYGTQVADVFYVKDIFGMKIRHETQLKHIREVLLQAINKETPIMRQ